jgi:hypothetical protein
MICCSQKNLLEKIPEGLLGDTSNRKRNGSARRSSSEALVAAITAPTGDQIGDRFTSNAGPRFRGRQGVCISGATVLAREIDVGKR